MEIIKKKPVIIAGGIIIFIILAFIVISRFLSPGQEAVSTDKQLVQEELIPTVDSSVIVTLRHTIDGKEVILKVENAPAGTESIDYELSYQTEKQGLQGVIGVITLSGKNGYEKQMTLGTCSSGRCVYHEVMGKIKVNLKFTGSYGEKVFEKEF